jgi:D-alanine-D-alanine ligase-like ATP-grasp enzyme
MKFHLHILLNRSPLEKTWVRSPEERVFLQQASDSYDLAQEFISRTENLSHTIHVVEETSKSSLELALKKEHSIVLNLCVGIELDGLPGPSTTMFLERLGIPFLGPSSLFQTRTFDKIKLKQILTDQQIATPKYWFMTPRCDISVFGDANYPLRLRPADSLAPVGRNGMDLVVFNMEDFSAALKKLRTYFPLVLVEEHNTNTCDFWFLVTNHQGSHFGKLIGQTESSKDATNLALRAYGALGGKGHAVVQVAQDHDNGQYCVRDVITNNALLWAYRILGKESVIKYLNQGLQALAQ